MENKSDIIKQIEDSDCKNVCIFIDYDNIYHTFRNFGLNVEETNFNIVLKMHEFYGFENIKAIKAYADFDQIDVKLIDLQKNRVEIKQVFGNGRGEQFRKNASDIELSLDAQEMLYNNNLIDTYVFCTADSDMIPIMNRLLYHNKQVHLFYIGTNISQYQDITSFAHIAIDLIKVFDIDITKSEPSYYKEQVVKHIKDWYSNNKNKIYGGKWLREDLGKTLNVSKKLASEIIEYLEKEQIIKLINKNRDGKFINGYMLSGDIIDEQNKTEDEIASEIEK